MRQFLYRQRKEISIPGSEESGAYGGGGLLCCFLRSGKERADGGSTPLLVLRFLPVLGSSVGFASSLFLSYPARSLCLSLLYTLFPLFFCFCCLVLPSLLFFSPPSVSYLPPLVSSFFSPFIAKTACLLFYYNENVRDHYCSGNGREIVAVKCSP